MVPGSSYIKGGPRGTVSQATESRARNKGYKLQPLRFHLNVRTKLLAVRAALVAYLQRLVGSPS